MKNSKDCISILIGFFHEKINDWTCLHRFQTVVEKKMFGLLSIVSIFCGVSDGKYLNFRAKNMFCGTFPKLSVIILCRSEVWRWYRSRLEKKWRGHLWTVKKHLPFFLVANSGLATCVTYFDREELKQLTRLQIFWTHVQELSFKFFYLLNFSSLLQMSLMGRNLTWQKQLFQNQWFEKDINHSDFQKFSEKKESEESWVHLKGKIPYNNYWRKNLLVIFKRFVHQINNF